jgi:GT2 family glycosyltransferase
LKDREQEVIAVGSCRSSDGSVSFGGLRQASHLLPLHFEPIGGINEVAEADTFNGNVVLSSFWVHSKLGGFPRGYTHLRADIDFGLTAKKFGYLNLVTERPVATCERSSSYKSYASLKGMSLVSKIREINQPKFGPIGEHIRLAIRHGGWLSPIYALAPIIRALLTR